MCKIKIYQWTAWFFAITFVLSVAVFFVGLASMRMGITYSNEDNGEYYNKSMDRANKCIFIAAIGLLISYPLTNWFDKKARKLIEKEYKPPDVNKDDMPRQPTNPKLMDLLPRDKPLKGKG